MDAASHIESSNGSTHQVWQWNPHKDPAILALHGFTGRGSDFALCADRSPDYAWIAPDVVGRTPGGEPAVIGIDCLCDALTTLLERLPNKRRLLLGYSMGGRIAVSTALKRPDLIDGLILVGATAGIEGDEDRRLRRLSDIALAERARRDGPAAFMDDWRKHPLIRSQARIPEPWGQRLRDSRNTHTAEDLAQCLEQYGQGSLPPMWEGLRSFEKPVLIVAGEDDARYRGILPRFREVLPCVQTCELPGAGHAAHLETPEVFAACLQDWIGSRIH